MSYGPGDEIVKANVLHRPSQETVALLQTVVQVLPPPEEAYLVGGFLRDALLGRATHDIDIAIADDALPAARRLADALGGAPVLLDEPRRIARVVLDEGDGIRHLDVASLQGDLHQDLARRDFTIDAMAVPLHLYLTGHWQGGILDPFDGRQDLERGVIRALNPAVFQDDGARLLRAVRLASLLGFKLEESTRSLIQRDAAALDGVSAERLRDELLAILAIPGASASVYLMDDLGLLCRLVPELEQGRDIQQPKEHYWDVFRHNVETVGAVESLLERRWDPPWVLDQVPWDGAQEEHFREVVSDGHTRATLCKLAGLLHDVAKPATKTVEPSGRIRFLGHNTQGAAIARSVLQRLRFSGRGVQMIELMVDLHLRPGQMSQGVELPTPHAVYRFLRRAGDVALDVIYLNLGDYLAARGAYLERTEWSAYAGMVRHILETGRSQQQTVAQPRLLDGHDLMDLLGIEPGPQVGLLLEAVEEARAAGEVNTREEALALAGEHLASRRSKAHA